MMRKAWHAAARKIPSSFCGQRLACPLRDSRGRLLRREEPFTAIVLHQSSPENAQPAAKLHGCALTDCGKRHRLVEGATKTGDGNNHSDGHQTAEREGIIAELGQG